MAKADTPRTGAAVRDTAGRPPTGRTGPASQSATTVLRIAPPGELALTSTARNPTTVAYSDQNWCAAMAMLALKSANGGHSAEGRWRATCIRRADRRHRAFQVDSTHPDKSARHYRHRPAPRDPAAMCTSQSIANLAPRQGLSGNGRLLLGCTPTSAKLARQRILEQRRARGSRRTDRSSATVPDAAWLHRRLVRWCTMCWMSSA